MNIVEQLIEVNNSTLNHDISGITFDAIEHIQAQDKRIAALEKERDELQECLVSCCSALDMSINGE